MIIGNERGGRAAALFYSLITTCKAYQIDPKVYLHDVMLRRAEGVDPTWLTPREWKKRFAAEVAERRDYVLRVTVTVQLTVESGSVHARHLVIESSVGRVARGNERSGTSLRLARGSIQTKSRRSTSPAFASLPVEVGKLLLPHLRR